MNASELAFIAKLLYSAVDEYYDEWNRPKNYVAKAFLDELPLS